MDKFGKSQPVKRVEDVRFLTGHGRYVDDVAPDGALRAFVFRSPVAHAEITTLDVEAAREAEGVHLVVTSEDLLAAGIDTGMSGALAPNRDGSKGAAPKRPVLAEGRLRYVGEPVAVVVAETLEQARWHPETMRSTPRRPTIAPMISASATRRPRTRPLTRRPRPSSWRSATTGSSSTRWNRAAPLPSGRTGVSTWLLAGRASGA